MDYIGLYKKDVLWIEYCESEHYYYRTYNGVAVKHFKTNSFLNAFAKCIHDLGQENITFTENGERWLKMYLTYKDVYENTLMEHAIGLSSKYNLKNLVNAKGEKLKRYCAWRNYYNVEPNDDDYDIIQELVKFGFMKEFQPSFFKCTWQGIYWLECKYDIKIYEDE